MRFKGPVLFSLFGLLILGTAYFPSSMNIAEKESILLKTLVSRLNYLHFKPLQIDDEFSHKVFDNYIDNLDGFKQFFTQKDIQQLEVYKDRIDNDVKSGNLEFFELSIKLFEKAIEKSRSYYKEILEKPFNFDIAEDIELDSEKRINAKNDIELKENWRKYLKYETMTRYLADIEKQKDLEKEEEKKSELEIEKEARKEVSDFCDRWFDRLEELKREDRLSIYLNSITQSYDPHTNYLKPIDKENFNIRFSGRLEGIGARLQRDKDYTKVANIVVGGPAWKGKDLEENDLILKVGQGNEEPVDIRGMQLDDVVQLIRGDKGTEVKLTVKKVDGSTKEISIIRDIVIIDEGFARSLIIDGDNEGEKIGYLYLPSFYADFQNPDGRFCHKDVAKELEKLKNENVGGIILDLRNNGGGALRDAVKMSGFFIEEGPIVQLKSKDDDPKVLRDTDPSVKYNGPLVVLVNSFSASASEILAAALQDYKRAVIVGSNSTFGKGTVQQFVNLDRTVRGFENFKPFGEVKLTTQKFYRINGGSTQLKGVVPDIILPDNYHYISIGEKDEKNALKWTEINPVNYSQNVLLIDDLNMIKVNSKDRVEADSIFNMVFSNAKRLKNKRDNSIVPLSIDEYKEKTKSEKAEAKKYKTLYDTKVNYGVRNLVVDLPSFENNESKKARNEDFISTVSKDIYINESIHILNDLINLN